MSTRKVKYGIKDFEKELGRLTFGQMLESYRLSEEQSLKTMAKKLGISASSVCDLEKGRRIPSLGRVRLIAKKLKVSEKLWVQATLQDQLDKEKLNYEVTVGEAS